MNKYFNFIKFLISSFDQFERNVANFCSPIIYYLSRLMQIILEIETL